MRWERRTLRCKWVRLSCAPAEAQPLLSGQPVARGGGAHPKCAASGLQFPSSPSYGCFSAERRSLIAAHQQEQARAGPDDLGRTNTWVIADQVDYEEQDSAKSEEDAEDGTKDGSEWAS